MARIDPTTFAASDGVRLEGAWYRPAGEADAVVVVAGATAVPHRFYARWAADLADRGFEVLTFDYRGVGASSGAVDDATMQDWGRRDVSAAIAAARARAAGRPVSYVGHSFGGQALGLADGVDALARGVLVAAGWGWWGFQPLWRRPLLMGVWYGVFPALLVSFGRIPARMGMGDGLPGGVAREWSRWCRSPNYLLDHVPDARANFARAEAPFTVWSVSDDGYIPHPAVAALAAVLPNAALSQLDGGRVPGGIGHFGVFRPAAAALWPELAAALRPPSMAPTVAAF